VLKNIKKTYIIVGIIALMFVLSACKGKKVEFDGRVGESEQTELSLVEQLVLSGVPVYEYDTEGNLVSINGEDPSSYLEESTTETEAENPIQSDFWPKEWPANEWTKLIPVPGYDKIKSCSSSERVFQADLECKDIETAKKFANGVKEKGFTVNAEENDYSADGMYIYNAEKSSGERINIYYYDGMYIVVIELPEV